MLNRLVGMLSGKDTAVAPPKRAPAVEAEKPAELAASRSSSVMRRGAMLGRDQKVAAYTFMLRRVLDEQTDLSRPDVQRLYDETLARQIGREVDDINRVHMDAQL